MKDGKRNNGGYRPGAGRKSKAEEQSLIEKIGPLEPLAFNALQKALENGDRWTIKMFLNICMAGQLKRFLIIYSRNSHYFQRLT